jgi:hypothetical protein
VPTVTLARVPDKRIFGGAAAGAVAAAVWAAQEPLDIKAFGVAYSDPELLAKPLGGSRLVGLPIHVANGAAFGAVYSMIAPRVPGPGVAKGAAAGMTEHLATWPLTRFLPGVQLWGNRRAFWQAAWRHLLFGAILGALEARLAAGYADRAPA